MAVYSNLYLREILERLNEMSPGGGTSLPNSTQAVYVAKHGSDFDTGLSVAVPKLTIASAVTAANALITGGASAVSIFVQDAGTYTEELVSGSRIEPNVSLIAPDARIVGRIQFRRGSFVVVGEQYASGNNQDLVELIASGTADAHGVYRARLVDGRGVAGTNRGTKCFKNDTNAEILFGFADVIYVPEDGVGIIDSSSASGSGHIHIIAQDVYLAGNDAIGIRANTADTNVVAQIGHILEIGTPTGTIGVNVTNASADVKLVINEIIADEVYNISAGSLHLVCPKLVGTRTGTPVCEISDKLIQTDSVECEGLTVKDDVDATKAVTLEVSGVTTGTTRTLTVPDENGTIALTSDTRFSKTIDWQIDSGNPSVPIVAGVQRGSIRFPYAGTITKWSLLGDVSGSIVLDIWKDTYANFPPTVADTITASAKPTISSDIKAESSTLTGWTTAVDAGDIFIINVDSCTSITRATLMLEITLT